MIPPSPPENVPPDISAHSLLQLGKPFLEAPRYSILEIQKERGQDDNPLRFTEWLRRILQVGQPVVLQDFDKLSDWDTQTWDIERLIDLSTKKNLPIRNCSTGRDLSFTLRKFVDSARQSYPEFQNLYARDLPCPQEWQELCQKILPSEIQWRGRGDLFQFLPEGTRSEVMMAYVGSEGSYSGFHRCISSTLVLNLLVQTASGSVICIGTDLDSQKKYDAFMSARGVSPNLDWFNLGPDTLKTADFPLYVCEQKVGDLVIFPPATAHQVWNPSILSTKLVWNILHPLSLEVGLHQVQPSMNRLCHPDVAQTHLSLGSAMLSLVQDGGPAQLPPELPLLTRLFRQMMEEESIDTAPVTPISLVTIPMNMVATCNFCGTAIWNRHLRCQECTDFDLCLSCYLSGRSCEHVASYYWAEIHPPEVCNRVLQKAREILGSQSEEAPSNDRRKTLGSWVNDLMKSKMGPGTRLCHLCRIDHPEWKGRRCDKCTAFFCFRGLYRHFDMPSADVLCHAGLWTCPKCLEICNCRCCHFQKAYVKAEKPASKRRVKPIDARGKVMGFTDNVFDQKRGQRTSLTTDFSTSPQAAGQKRPLAASESSVPTSYRKVEVQTPEREFSGIASNREQSADYVLEPQFSSVAQSPSQYLDPTTRRLPSISTLPEQRNSPRVSREHTPPPSSAESMSTLASAAASRGRMSNAFLTPNTPTHPALLSPYVAEKSPNFPRGTSIPNTDILTPLSGKPPTELPASTLLDNEISQLEDQIARLRRYGDELLGLSLHEAHKMLFEQLGTLELTLRDRKREKSALLIENLQREFPGIADVARREVEKLGYR